MGALLGVPLTRLRDGTAAGSGWGDLSVPPSLRARLRLPLPGNGAAAARAVPTEAEVFQRKLDETTRLLRELQDAQNERLSTRPPPNTICLLGPSYRELHLGRSRRGAPGTRGLGVCAPVLREPIAVPRAVLVVFVF